MRAYLWTHPESNWDPKFRKLQFYSVKLWFQLTYIALVLLSVGHSEYVSLLFLPMVAIEGIEPPQQGYEPSALAVMLYRHLFALGVGFEPTMGFPRQINSLVLSATERPKKIIIYF